MTTTTILSQEKILLAAIRADPADDAPRLAYADYLQENDSETAWMCGFCNGYGTIRPNDITDPFFMATEKCKRCDGSGRIAIGNGFAARAELIRVQIELANLDKKSTHTKDGYVYCSCGVATNKGAFDKKCQGVCLLRRREQELLSDPRIVLDDSCAAFRERQKQHDEFIVISRGFVSEVRCTLQKFLSHGPAIVAVHPVAKVVASDKKPRYVSLNKMCWCWWLEAPEHRLPDNDDLPKPIFTVLTGWKQSKYSTFYESEQLAIDALSQALIAWAKYATKEQA